MKKNIIKTLDFLDNIGINWHLVGKNKFIQYEKDADTRAYFSNIIIINGNLYFTNEVTLPDLLHESAHIATIPSKYRDKATGDVSSIQWSDLFYDYSDEELILYEWIYLVSKFISTPLKDVFDTTTFQKDRWLKYPRDNTSIIYNLMRNGNYYLDLLYKYQYVSNNYYKYALKDKINWMAK